MRTLRVGDVHAKPEDLADCEALLAFVLKTAKEQRVQRIVFLGDQYHTHAIVNVEVQRFWLKWFEILTTEGFEVIALKGNHDAPGDKNSLAHAMQVHRNQIKVIEGPTQIGDELFLPYFHDQLEFLQACKSFPGTSRVTCHATFNGARFENGFYAKEALDPELVPQKSIISGHIHTPASFSKVWYPGSPRWQTIGDANISRAIWVEDDSGGGECFSTDDVLKRIWQLVEAEAEHAGAQLEELLNPIKSSDRVVVNLQGSRAWCEQRKLAVASVRQGIRFRTFFTDQHSVKVRESEGIAAAFLRHFEAYNPKNGTSKDILTKMVQERGHVAA